jgi:VIT1/CCC1 family predicted Fe2+/Mn2+ transporter
MKHSLKTGLSFGLTSAIITTLGLMVGIYSGTRSRLAVLGSIIIIAIADALSDSLGIHMSEESENKHTSREIWESTIYTFLSKFIFAATFIFPVIIFDLKLAVIISIIWGLLLLIMFSFYLARNQKTSAWKVILEHIFVAVVVIIATHSVGLFIRRFFAE